MSRCLGLKNNRSEILKWAGSHSASHTPLVGDFHLSSMLGLSLLGWPPRCVSIVSVSLAVGLVGYSQLFRPQLLQTSNVNLLSYIYNVTRSDYLSSKKINFF